MSARDDFVNELEQRIRAALKKARIADQMLTEAYDHLALAKEQANFESRGLNELWGQFRRLFGEDALDMRPDELEEMRKLVHGSPA